MVTGKKLIWFVILIFLVGFVMTHIPLPVSKEPGKIPHLDKVLHFGLYFCLTFGASICLFQFWNRLVLTSLVIFPVMCVYASCDEWLQKNIPGRNMSLDDWIADVVGITLATIVFLSVIGLRAKKKSGDLAKAE